MSILKKITAETANKYLKTCKGFDKNISKVKVLEVKDGKCLAELKVEEEHLNPFGGLHGGLLSQLVDTISTFGLSSNPKVGDLITVSTDLHIRFMKGAKLNEEIIIDSKTVRAGNTLGFCSVNILNKKTKEILVQGSHTKFIMRPK